MNKSTKKIILSAFTIYMVIMTGLIIFNFGRMYQLKKDNEDVKQLNDEYIQLVNDFEYYKQHSYVLLGKDNGTT